MQKYFLLFCLITFVNIETNQGFIPYIKLQENKSAYNEDIFVQLHNDDKIIENLFAINVLFILEDMINICNQCNRKILMRSLKAKITTLVNDNYYQIRANHCNQNISKEALINQLLNVIILKKWYV